MMDKFYENRLAEMRNYIVLERTRKQVHKLYPKPVAPSYTPSAELTSANSFRLVVTSTDFLYAYLFSTNWANEVIKYKEEKRSRLFANAKPLRTQNPGGPKCDQCKDDAARGDDSGTGRPPTSPCGVAA